MGQNYTPTDEFLDYPVEIARTGDKFTEDFFNDKLRDLYNRIEHLKQLADADDTDFDKLKENLNNNVGGSVTEEGAPEYSGTNIVSNGDSHHTGIEKIDVAVHNNQTNVSNNQLAINSNLQKITNIANKIDPNAAEPGTFSYDNENFISDGERLKAIVEKFDRYMLGTRRNAEFGFAIAIENWKQTHVNAGDTINLYGYDTFYDTTKKDVLSDCTISVDQQEASGADTYYYRKVTATGLVTDMKFVWDINPGGTIEVRFSLVNETTWADMEVYTAGEGNYQTVVQQGSNFVVAVKITGTAKMYNLSFIGKGT